VVCDDDALESRDYLYVSKSDTEDLEAQRTRLIQVHVSEIEEIMSFRVSLLIQSLQQAEESNCSI
jgi:hypothetical protein